MQQARSRQFATRASPPPVALTKHTTAMVLSRIHESNLTEIALGEMAQDKASMSEVRGYADQLVEDHTNVDLTIVAMAQKSGLDLQNSVAHREGRHEIEHDKQLELKSASGADFDRCFLQHTSIDHERLIRELQKIVRMRATMNWRL
jgi:putative membrane protein